jgi:hypothetical protein
MRDKLLLTLLLVAGVLGVAWWALHLYVGPPTTSPPPAPSPYLRLARAALVRGLAYDFPGVAALSASGQPVVWLREAVRRDSALVATWTKGAPASLSLRRGDTTFVYWSTPAAGARCPAASDLTAGVVATSGGPKLVRLSSPCVPESPVAPITFELDTAR